MCSAHSNRRALHVLVADGERGARRSLALQLASLGCMVAQATSAAEALERVGADAIALAICDLALAGPGLELLPRLLEVEPGLSVVVMAGEPDVESVVEAVRLGATDYLAKPLTFAQLHRLVADEKDRAAAQAEDILEDHEVEALERGAPPLRSRPQDILPLARTIATRLARQRGIATPTFTPAARRLLVTWPWPGNVRELRDVLFRAMSTAEGGVLGADAFPDWMAARACDTPFAGAPLTAEALEREHVTRVVAWTSTLAEAAHVLGMSPEKLRRKLRSWDARAGEERRRGSGQSA